MTGIAGRPRAVVTGGSGGIGRRIIERLEADGFLVHACDVAEATGDPSTGSMTRRHRCDVGDPEQVAEMARTVADDLHEHGAQLQVVVNNAGVNLPGGLLTTTHEDFDRVLRTNLYGTFHVTRALVPMIARPGGVVITIASDQVERPKVGKLAYGISKAAVTHLARQVALEFAPHIRSVVVSPGPVNTEMLRSSPTAPDPGTIPLGRFAEAHEVAALVGFLAGPDAGYLTGANLAIDGGVTTS